MTIKIGPLQCSKANNTLTVYFPQIFYPFKTKKIRLFGQEFSVFPWFAEISTLIVYLSKSPLLQCISNMYLEKHTLSRRIYPSVNLPGWNPPEIPIPNLLCWRLWHCAFIGLSLLTKYQNSFSSFKPLTFVFICLLSGSWVGDDLSIFYTSNFTLSHG